jgi:hypothetical protein
MRSPLSSSWRVPLDGVEIPVTVQWLWPKGAEVRVSGRPVPIEESPPWTSSPFAPRVRIAFAIEGRPAQILVSRPGGQPGPFDRYTLLVDGQEVRQAGMERNRVFLLLGFCLVIVLLCIALGLAVGRP